MGPFTQEEIIRHDLQRHYAALRRIPTRKALLRHPLYAEIGPALGVLDAVERGTHPAAQGPARPGVLRAVAWNIQRGRAFSAILAALQGHPVLAAADVLLLSEVDNGLWRSGNRDVARELAAGLGMNYAFGVSYLTLQNDWGEDPAGLAPQENTLALAGAAVLSRLPIGRVENVDLPELRDKFSSRSEKRLGKKRALLAEIAVPGWDLPLRVAAVHLDSNAAPRQRAAQLGALLRRLGAAPAAGLLGGGDLNTTTYDASGTLALLRDILHKLVITGFRNTVDQYMTPERFYERPVFAALAEHGFTTEGYNDRAAGTFLYDLNSAYAIQKTRKKVGGLLTALLRRSLRPWNGVVQARLDWFFGRGLTPLSAQVVDVRDEGGQPASDHAAVVLDLTIPR